jgi:signal transduction histidine kinase
MTLRRKMGLQITSMIVGLLLISGASLWGLNGLRQDYGAAVAGYQELRQIFEVGSNVAISRALLTAQKPDSAKAANAIQAALTLFERGEPWSVADRGSYESIHNGLKTALTDLNAWQGDSPPPTDSLNSVHGQIAHTVSDVGKRVQASQDAAERKRRATLVAVGTLSGVVILAAFVLGLWQYLSVLSPLQRLGAAVRRVATGQFGVRIMEAGLPSGRNHEFATLARDFNRMAEQLDNFYRDLEQKVAAKSKELIRSERLASVGYLAAGVAHEINNPLGIISGYAEYALAEMKNGKPGDASTLPPDIDGTLRVIRDEAFRCKDITGKLLSLARQGDTQRNRVNLADVAEQVVSILAGLRDFKQRTITVRAEQRETLIVDAIEGEMKQVLMNLLINAFEATDDGAGEVKIIITRTTDSDLSADTGEAVTLTVADNGRGMAPETLERVFEPFFTERRPRDPGQSPKPGTGLGLSITHAIVQSHNGRITADSDGSGMGSRFVMELPAAREIA